MAKTNETGHAKNVANFEKLIDFCNGYGIEYNPSRTSIRIDALTVLMTNAEVSLENLKNMKTAFDNATNERELSFKPLKKLATKVVNSLASTEASKLTLADAVAANKKIQGRRAKEKPATKKSEEEEAGKEVNKKSVSQQSFDGVYDNFKSLVKTVSAEPLYTPNEPELQVASLNLMLAAIKGKDTAVDTATTNLSNARITRNKTLYGPKTGLYEITQAVKNYVKSLHGATNPKFKQVSKIKFTEGQ